MKRVAVYRTFETHWKKPEEKTCFKALKNLGWSIDRDKILIKEQDEEILENFLDGVDLLMIYNGMRDICKKVVNMARKKKVKTLFNEIGFLPQVVSSTVDPDGLACQSSLNKSIDWVTSGQIQQVKKELRESNLYGHYLKYSQPQRYILAAGQLLYDSQVKECCNLTNADVILKACELRNEYGYPVIFRPHPRMFYEVYWDPSIKDDSHTRYQREISHLKELCDKNDVYFIDHTIEGKTSFCSSAVNSFMVVAMNSTSLVESMALEKPVLAMADCPIKKHINDKGLTFDSEARDKLLAAYYLSQFTNKELKKCEEILKRHGV